jgi:hypothetical protein
LLKYGLEMLKYYPPVTTCFITLHMQTSPQSFAENGK